MAAAYLLLGILAAGQPSADGATAEVDAIVAQLRTTRMEIASAHLEWTKVTEENGFTAPGRVARTVSRYTCDLAGGRMVVDALEQNVHIDPDGVEAVRQNHVVSSWDGRLLVQTRGKGRRLLDYSVDARPAFPLYHNLLGLVFRSAAGDAESIVPDRLIPSPPPDARRDVSWVEFEGEPTLRVTYSSCDGTWMLHFAIERGGYLVAEDLYDGECRTVATRTQLSDALGVWFPNQIESRSFARDGTVSLMHRREIDEATSSINVPSQDDARFTVVTPTGLCEGDEARPPFECRQAE